MTEIFKASTVEEAKALAAKKFGKDIRSIKFEIIEEGKKGLFGIGKKEAVVKASFVEAAPVKPAAAVKPAANVQPVKKSEPAAVVPKSAPASKPAEKAKPEIKTETAEKIEEKKAEPVKKTEKNPAENAFIKDDMEEFSIENFTLIEDEALIHSKVKLARDYITSILRAIDINAEFQIYQNETGAVINIESDNNGTVIGRRGETLDAIQYLCSIIANKGDKDYFRITIDCLGYRSKRKETLEQLAAKVAKSVLRTGRSQPLEPMNPYERRVIHSAISEIEEFPHVLSAKSLTEKLSFHQIILSTAEAEDVITVVTVEEEIIIRETVTERSAWRESRLIFQPALKRIIKDLSRKTASRAVFTVK